MGFEYLWAWPSVTKGLYHLNWDANDSSGNGNNWTNTNITYGLAYGKFWQGALFNGSSSSIGVPVNISWAITVVCWFYATSTPPKDTHLVTRDGGTTFWENQFNLWFSSWLRWAVNPTEGQGERHIVDSMPANNQRHCAIGVFTGSWWEMKLYLNWALKWSLARPSATQASWTTTYIWRRWNWWYFPWNIDEVIIENRAWTASEVKKYYTYAKGRRAN